MKPACLPSKRTRPVPCEPARRGHERRGALTVEFALCVPIVFTVFFGCMEVSRMNMIRNTQNNAAFEAARTICVPGGTVATGKSTATTLMNAVGVTNATITVTPNPITSLTTNVTVAISTPLTANLYLTPQFLKNITLNSTCTLKVESPTAN